MHIVRVIRGSFHTNVLKVFHPRNLVYDSLQGYGGYAGFHFSLLLALLLDQRKITALMSSYQILRVALQTIGIALLPPWGVVCAFLV